MGLHRCPGPGGVAGFDLLEKQAVKRLGPLTRPRILHKPQPGFLKKIDDRVNHEEEQVVACCIGQSGVKVEIGLDVGGRIVQGRIHARNGFLELRNMLGSGVQGSKCGNRWLYRLAQLMKMPNGLVTTLGRDFEGDRQDIGGDFGDKGADPRFHDNDSPGFQKFESLAERRPADSQQLSELIQGWQPAANAKLAAAHEVENLPRNLIG